DVQAALKDAYATFAQQVPGLKILLSTYFGDVHDNLDTAADLPVAGLHVDLVRAPCQVTAVFDRVPADKVLSLGVIDGRNIWRADLNAIIDRIAPFVTQRGADKVQIAPSCSLLHVPVDLEA